MQIKKPENIMLSYRITKYNPTFRNSLGWYEKNDWTSISDIGKQFDGKELTFEDYIKIEDAYVQAIMLFMDFLKLNSLTVTYLEKYWKRPIPDIYRSKTMLELFKKISVGQELDKSEVADIARLMLRETVWCKPESKDKMFIHFGWDYYMYIGSAEKPAESMIATIEKSGLFVEEFESPYLEDQE